MAGWPWRCGDHGAHNAAFADFVDVLPRHLPARVVACLTEPFAGPDPAGLRNLLDDAGFHPVHLRIAVVSVRFGSTRSFFDAETRGSPLADPVDALSRTARTRLAADVEEALAPHADDEGLLLPMQTSLVLARRPTGQEGR